MRYQKLSKTEHKNLEDKQEKQLELKLKSKKSRLNQKLCLLSLQSLKYKKIRLSRKL